MDDPLRISGVGSLLVGSLVAGGEFVAAGSAARGQHITTGDRTHALAETVFVRALALAGLVGTFHGLSSFLCPFDGRGGKCRRFPLSAKRRTHPPRSPSGARTAGGPARRPARFRPRAPRSGGRGGPRPPAAPSPTFRPDGPRSTGRGPRAVRNTRRAPPRPAAPSAPANARTVRRWSPV